MGNVSSRSTLKLELLTEEMNDFSFTVSNEISQSVTQNITVVQNQDVIIDIKQIEGCSINISQNAQIFANQYAEFSAILTSPRELLRYYVLSPNSIYNQAIRSSSEVMKEFLETSKKAFNIEADERNIKLKATITNILKTNLSTKSIQSCSQNIFVVQNQFVKILGDYCKDTSITIDQNLIVNAAQSCIMEIFENSLLKNATFRRALREFNGDYKRELLDENLDAGAIIPDRCFFDQEPDIRVRDCPKCEQCIIPTNQFVPPDYQTIVLRAWFIYGTLIIILVIMVIITILKYKNNKLKN